MRLVGFLVLGLVGVVVGVLLFGPRTPVDREISFDPARLPEDLDAYLAEAEAKVPDLRDGVARHIVWAGEAGAPTPLSIVYLHGYSATLEEIRPVPDLVADGLGANLHYARLAGHGRDGAAMAEPSAGDWIEDTAEALAIGRRIGERVLVIATSTGGSLAALAAHDPALSEDLAGIVLVSPNFRINRADAFLLTLPWAERWVPVLAGEMRSWEPANARHGAFWTTEYPTVAIMPMAALVKHVRDLDFAQTDVPALFVYSEHDTVVAPEAIHDVIAAWGGPKQVAPLVMTDRDDPGNHVIAGDIMSPGQTQGAAQLMIGWAEGL